MTNGRPTRALLALVLLLRGGGPAVAGEPGDQPDRAVTALIDRLETDPQPMAVVEALGEKGDPRATAPLLRLLEARRPLSGDREGSAERRTILLALARIGDPGAAPPLRRILDHPPAGPATRLWAATALTRLGTADDRRQARAFILWADTEARTGSLRDLPVAGPFTPVDLDRALAAVGDGEAQGRLASRLLASAVPGEKLEIIPLLGARPDPNGTQALGVIADRRTEEPQVRVRAIQELVRLGSGSREALVADLEDLRGRAAAAMRPAIDELLANLQTEH